MSLELVPVDFATAARFVKLYHRHNKPPAGHKFSIGVASNNELVGVAMIGRPVARMFDDGLTLEVNRTVTTGHQNANSMLYGASARATFALGYRRLITYTQGNETGASVKAAGFRIVAERPPRAGWNTPTRPRFDNGTEHTQRTLWEVAK